MTSRGPDDAWTPGGILRPDAPVTPPVVGNNPAQIVPPRLRPSTADDSTYSAPRHASPDGPVHPPEQPGPDVTGTARKGPWARLVHAATKRSRTASLDAALNEHLTSIPPSTYGKVAFVCAKGGVSKTMHTMSIAAILAQHTSVPVVAVDFNPDQGTLGVRAAARESWGLTIRELIDTITSSLDSIDLDSFITKHDTGASVVISGNTSLDAKDITAMQYESVMNALHEMFPVILIDTGNSMTTEVYESILRTVDQVVVVGQFSVDAAVTAANTHARIRQAGGRLEAIANQSLVSFTTPKYVNSRVDRDLIREYFADATASGSMREIAWDSHLDEGSVIDLDKVNPDTRRELMILAADIASALAGKPLFSTSVLPDFL